MMCAGNYSAGAWSWWPRVGALPPGLIPPCAQLFNQLNARKILDSSLLLEGLGQVPLFSAVLAGEALLQASRPPAEAARTSLVKGGGSTRRGGDAGAGLASPCFVRSG